MEELERYSVKYHLTKHINSPLFKRNKQGTWCYYYDAIKIISEKNQQIKELKRQVEILKVK